MIRLTLLALLLSSPGALINPMSSTSSYPYPPNPRCGLWIARGAEWTDWRLEGVSAVQDGLLLREPAAPAPSTAGLVPTGSASGGDDAGRAVLPTLPGTISTLADQRLSGAATGPIVETSYPFTNLVASWNAQTPPHCVVECCARVRIGNRWSRWYQMGRWAGPGSGASIRGQADSDGKVEVDTLVLNHPADACQMKMEMAGHPSALPLLTLASLCWYNPAAPPPPAPAVTGRWQRTIPVPAYSQMVQDTPAAGSMCSPTSLAMILSFHGVSCTPMEAAAGVRDTDEDMYGNWPMNTAYAASRGCPSYVARFWCMEQLENEIAAGRPVEASIRWGKGQLDGAPIQRSNGHLVVVAGFTAGGDVVVNDPAARDHASVTRVYRREQFEHVWQEGSGGIVYLVEPPPARLAASGLPGPALSRSAPANSPVAGGQSAEPQRTPPAL